MAKLYFRYGSMNSGKSTLLLQVAHNYNERDMKVLILKPKVDTKGENTITGRMGISRKVDYLISSRDKITKKVSIIGVSAIIVDEAQFLTSKQVDELYKISKYADIPVLCYGLRCDFQMKGFPGATRLLEIADTIEELKTICKCGVKATQNMRLLNDVPIFTGDQILIDGAKDSIFYLSVCGKCYLKAKELSEEDYFGKE